MAALKTKAELKPNRYDPGGRQFDLDQGEGCF